MDHLDHSSDQEPRYAELVERAIAYIVESGGAVQEEMLVNYVFGASSSPKLWSGLLDTILGNDPRVSKSLDGLWSATVGDVELADTPEFVVVDVETTGLKPRHNRITEVAIVSVSKDGDAHSTWSTLVNPERRIPAQIARLTGIQDQDVATAPVFRSIAPTIVNLVGNSVVVGHNVDFDMSFLNAELQRAGYSRLINATLDTMSLADVLIPDLRRLSLAAVASALGSKQVESHRALPDAETTLSVFSELRALASESGRHASFHNLQNIAARRKPRRRHQHAVGRGRSILDDSLIDGVPHAPGVYIMRDRGDRVIYVGKAIDLRKRLSSYFSQPLGYTRKMDGLLESIVRIEVEVVGSELEALVLESQLIRRYRPRFNRQQRNAEQYTYIRVDLPNPWPTVTVAKDWKDDGATYFGPFRSERHCRDVVQMLNDVLPLRTCKRSFRDARSLGNPCIELSLKRCAGPCIGKADADVYRGVVDAVLTFFDGDGSVIQDILHQRLERAAEAMDYERARRLRDQIRRLSLLARDHQRVQDLKRHGDALLVLPGVEDGYREAWYLRQGQRWAQLTVENENVEDVGERLKMVRDRALQLDGAVIDHHHTVDESALIWRWLNQRQSYEGFIPWDDRDSTEMAYLVLRASLADQADEKIDEHTDDPRGAEMIEETIEELMDG